MDNQKVFYTIVAMSVVTFLPRFVPAWLLSSVTLPDALARWLKFVPAAVLSTLLWPSLLVRDHHLDLSTHNLGLMVAIPTAVVAFVTRSFLGTVILGVALMAGCRYLLSL